MNRTNHGIGRERSPNVLGAFKVATLVCAIVLAWLAFKPADGTVSGFPWDKANHFASFVVLTGLSACGWPRASAVRLTLIMLATGIAIELIQGTPLIHRDADVWDVVADMVGVVAAWGLLAVGRVRARLV